MSFRNRQRGLSFLGLIALVGTLGFLAVIGLKLIPIYMESWKIDGFMNAVISDSDIHQQSRVEIRKTIMKRFGIESVDAINHKNYKDHLTITKGKSQTTINIYYRVETPLIGNLTLVADFDKNVSS